MQATNDSLLVQIVDPYSGVIERSFSTESDQEISYKNTPILQKDGVDAGKDVRHRIG